jgi:PAS domain S-box-containing protein
VTIDPLPQETRAAAAMPPAATWSTQQLTGFLALVSSAEDERSASLMTVERTAEALEAEVAALVRGHELVASVGLPSDPTLERALVEVATGEATSLALPELGDCPAFVIPVEDDTAASIVVARRAGGSLAPDELQLARGMARVLGLSLRLFRLAEQERRQRDEAETQSLLNQRLLESLQERQELLERLSRIQRSIAHGTPRDEVFQAICEDARELLGEELVGLRLIPPDDPTVLELVAVVGPDAAELRGQRIPLGAGLGGRALSEDRLVATEDYQSSALGLEQYQRRGLTSGMAAPVYEHGRPVGSLVVAAYGRGHAYTATERDMLIALADHASLAISDSRRIEAMRERDAARMNTRFRSLVQNSSDMIAVIDPDGSIAYVSPSAERTLAAPEGGLEGAPLAQLIHPDDRAEALAFLDAVARDNTSAGPVEWRLRGRTGWLDVETIASGQLDDPDVGGVVLNSREVTERRRLEAQLRQSQRLESVGQLAGGVAHDFNNFLSVIRGYAVFLEDALPGDSPLKADAGEISKAAERAARLTNQLLVFSRRDVVRNRVLDLTELLAGMRTLLERTVGEGVALRTQAAADLWRVEADPSQVEQVLMNLAVNARDAMAGDGSLELRLDNVELDAHDVRGRAAVAGRYVRLCVRDEGAGMAPEVVEHAFEPFYTTKPKGQGTGLGLATVYGIVTQAGGSVTISSAPGEGTAVEVLLPATGAEPSGDGAADREPTASEPARGETILVAEDEDAVRRLTQRMLTRAGYTVIEAAGGAAALAAWEAHPGEIDLLLTDVVMPGMSGKELADRLGVVPVFMSGYTDDVILRHGVDAGQPRLVQKPFDADTLLAAVRAALDAAPRRA